MNKKMDDQKSKVKGLFALEDEAIEPKPPKTQEVKPKRRPTKPKPSAEKVQAPTEEKPRFLTTKQASRGILHCEIGPELYERAALFAYDTQSPVKDMTDLARKCLIAFLDQEEPRLKELKEFYESRK